MSRKTLAILGICLVVALAFWYVLKNPSSDEVTDTEIGGTSTATVTAAVPEESYWKHVWKGIFSDFISKWLDGSDGGIAPDAPIEGRLMQLSYPVALMINMGYEAAGKITDSGALENNAETEGKSYTIESQRSGVYAVAGGIAAGDEALIDAGLKAYEWGFDQMDAQGTFPLERANLTKIVKFEHIHPVSFFVETAARSVILIREAPVDKRYKDRAEALVPKLLLAAKHMNNEENLRAFYADGKDTNMLTTPAAAFQEIAFLTGDKELEVQAKWMVEQVLARQYDDGTFPEKPKCTTPDQACYGFDTTYQMVSLEYLARYAGLVKDPVWKATVSDAVAKGAKKFLSKVGPNGRIDTLGNSRTSACGLKIEGTEPKGRGIDIIPLRLYYLGLFLNEFELYAPVAEKIQEYGQGFDHSKQCEDADISDDDE